MLVVFGLTTCVSIIEFDTSESSSEIVIFGKLTNAENYDQRITVKRTDLNTKAGLSIQNANVAVIDESTGETYAYRYSAEQDSYLPATTFVGIPGHTYRAQIAVEDQNYESSLQTMPLFNASDSSYFQFEKELLISKAGVESEQYRLKILTDSHLNEIEETLFMKWDVEQIYIISEVVLPSSKFPFYSPRVCYVFEGFSNDELVLFNGDLVDANLIQRQELATIPLDNSFVNIRGYGIIQSSITREAAIYWQRVKAVSNRVGSIFEVPPAPVPGNFRDVNNANNSPLGFFEVAKVDTSGTYVTPGDLPVSLGLGVDVPNCDYPITLFGNVPQNCFPCLEDLGVPGFCVNCTLLPNSTRKRPSYLF